MSIIKRRSMRPTDLAAVADHLKGFDYHYGALDDAVQAELMKSLLMEKAITGLILEQTTPEDDSNSQIIALGVTGFLDLEFAQELVEREHSQPVVDSLYQQEANGEHVFLRPSEIAKRNSSDGMALMFLHFSAPAGDPMSEETQRAFELMHSNFRLHHGGYHCRLALHPIPAGDERGIEALLSIGFKPVGKGDQLFRFDFNVLDKGPFHPFSCLRRTAPPRLGFSDAEKDLLTQALWGSSDREIAESSRITIDTVRKRWRSIFQRVSDNEDIHIFPSVAEADKKSQRGPEKRGLVLQYIDAHLEEIRPYAA